MHEPPDHSQKKITSDKQHETEDRRTRRRDDGVLSRIEDVTYSVLRKHNNG